MAPLILNQINLDAHSLAMIPTSRLTSAIQKAIVQNQLENRLYDNASKFAVFLCSL